MRRGTALGTVLFVVVIGLHGSAGAEPCAAGSELPGCLGDPGRIEGAAAGVTGGTEGCLAADYGSLRACLSRPGRLVHVHGAILCPGGVSAVEIPDDTTVQGGTLIGCGYRVKSRNVIVRDARVIGARYDCFTAGPGAAAFAFDHVTADLCGDGAIDLVEGAEDGTVQYALILDAPKSTLIRDGAASITLWRNVFASRDTFRAPQLDDTRGIVDVRQNLILDFGPYAALNRCQSRANFVGNYFARGERDRVPITRRTASSCPGILPDVHAAGNVWSEGNANAASNVVTPYAAPPVPEASICRIAPLLLLEAGARPRLPQEHAALAGITLPGCDPASAIPR